MQFINKARPLQCSVLQYSCMRPGHTESVLQRDRDLIWGCSTAGAPGTCTGQVTLLSAVYCSPLIDNTNLVITRILSLCLSLPRGDETKTAQEEQDDFKFKHFI